MMDLNGPPELYFPLPKHPVQRYARLIFSLPRIYGVIMPALYGFQMLGQICNSSYVSSLTLELPDIELLTPLSVSFTTIIISLR